MKKLVLLLTFFAVCTASAKKPGNGATYTNPVKTTMGEMVRIADPFVYEKDGTYYLTGTTATAEAAGFDYYTSKDLVVWEYKGELFRKEADHFGVGAFWAPEVEYYNGKFYMTYSCLDAKRGILLSCLAVSETPQGPFKELYTPWFDLGHSAIDCNIFVDDDKDRTPYLYFSKNGHQDGYGYGENYVVQLTPDLSKFVGEPVLVSRASQEWEKARWEVNRCNEGVFAFKHKGTYYMTYSANDTGFEYYGTGVATAKHPLGPWVKSETNPLMTTDLSNGVSSPGHSSMVMSPNGKEMFIVYHRHADPNGKRPSHDRVVCIDRVYVDKNGELKLVGPTNTPQPLPR